MAALTVLPFTSGAADEGPTPDLDPQQQQLAAAALEDRLGGDFEGAWVEDGVLVVDVTTTRAAETVRAEDVRPRLVEHSREALREVQAELAAQLDGTGATVAVDQRRNQVVLSVPDSSTSRHLLDTAQRHGDLVVVETAPAPVPDTAEVLEPADSEASDLLPTGDRTPDLVGGEAIGRTPLTRRCSSGFTATNPETGQRYVITAGHCKYDPSYYELDTGRLIGPWINGGPPNTDIAAIEITNDDVTISSAVTTHDGDRVQVESSPSRWPLPGQTLCKSGSTTGYTCGTVTRTGVTVNYASYGTVHNMIQADIVSDGGDSGGAWLSPSGTPFGIHSGSRGEVTPRQAFAYPIGQATRKWGLVLDH